MISEIANGETGITRDFEVASHTDPSKSYVVKLWAGKHKGFREGSLSCSCMSWRFQRLSVGERSCKHTREVEKALLDHNIAEKVEGSTVTFKEEIEPSRLEVLLDTMAAEGKL